MNKDQEVDISNSSEAVPTAAADPTLAIQRTRAFRRKLLVKLPKLSTSEWSGSDTMDVLDDLQIVHLDSDAFLEPLEKLSDGQHG